MPCSRTALWTLLLGCLTIGFHRDTLAADGDTRVGGPLEVLPDQRIALIGNSTAERMNLFGHFETRLHLRLTDRRVVFRNFGWPGDEVAIRQRPGNYTEIDDPFLVFDPDLLICFFGFNESFSGDDAATIDQFCDDYAALLKAESERLGHSVRSVLVSPIAFESTDDPLRPDGVAENARLKSYRDAVERVARETRSRFVDVFTPTRQAFTHRPGNQFTINGIHLNEAGDALVAEILDRELFGDPPASISQADFERVRHVVNDKSWLHSQDYRMLNGWYVYGGRRTWDTETFPTEYRKIREMVAVRDRYLWDLVAGRDVPPEPDDSGTGEVFIPETMFGSRDDKFREMREPETLAYPTPEESIDQMTVPDGFEVQLFASEREFPELANPTQIAFDSRGRLWVSCMVNYPQWLPGKSRPDDRLLILEDTDDDGRADRCTRFYDKLICPTGFEFHRDGVLVVDEPRILFLRDTDGDDVADEVTHLLDGIGTDDTHHAAGAWEYSPGGKLHMLEGIAMATAIETPYGVRRQQGASGAYVWDVLTGRIDHFRTPGQYNPWCLVFDKRGNGIIGDGTNANQHWATLFSGGEVASRASVDAIFNNHGIRPAAGNEMLTTRQYPAEYHDQLIYACVINLHGMPAFRVGPEPDGAGLTGRRADNLIESTDMFFRPVDPKIGPDGALWFGDWCNALIGHMQYSQRDPNRDHQHGRIYRLIHRDRPLLEPVTQANASIDELLEQLRAYETRTRYRARRELAGRDRDAVLAATSAWAAASENPDDWREALWVQQSHHGVDVDLVRRVLTGGDDHHRGAAIHVVGEESGFLGDEASQLISAAATDPHPRVRLEAARAASLQPSVASVRSVLAVATQPMDKWVRYVVDHAIQTLAPEIESEAGQAMVAELDNRRRDYLKKTLAKWGSGALIAGPMKNLLSESTARRESALAAIVAAPAGSPKRGAAVFSRICASCHRHGDVGQAFGPELTQLPGRMTKAQMIRSIVWPNDEIAKGYETIMVVDYDGVATAGFILEETPDQITLGIADGKKKTIAVDEIEIRKEMKASSMPEGLTETIAAGEFLDLLEFLMQKPQPK